MFTLVTAPTFYTFGNDDPGKVGRCLCVSRPGLGEEWWKGVVGGYAPVTLGVALSHLDVSTMVSWRGSCRMLLIQSVCSPA